jgi:Ca-activated chloride channel family protein
MEGLRFASLWCLILIVPVGMVLGWVSVSSRRRHAVIFSSVSGLKMMPVTWAQRIKRWLPWVYSAGLILIVLSLTRPQQGRTESMIRTEGIAIQIAMDVSGSLQAVDFSLNGETVDRLKAVKHVIVEFIRGSERSGLTGRRNDAVGLVSFGGFAYCKCPLTLDHGALIDLIDELKIPKPPRNRRGNRIHDRAYQEELNTAIGDGLALSVERLKNSTAKSKVLILLTDGENTAGIIQPLEAAKLAKSKGIKVYAIGVGRNGRTQVPQEDENGQTYLVPANYTIDEGLLKEIAQLTDGKYYHASNTDALREVYVDINSLEKSKVEEIRYAEYTELFPYLAIPGLLLMLGVGVLWKTRFLTLP